MSRSLRHIVSNFVGVVRSNHPGVVPRMLTKSLPSMLLEEFKNCLPLDIKTHLDERKADDLHQAAFWVDDYML